MTLYNILLMFRFGTIAITADIKQGFLQILVDKKIKTFFDFCGTMFSVFSYDLNIIVHQFTRVIFCLIWIPFLQNIKVTFY